MAVSVQNPLLPVRGPSGNAGDANIFPCQFSPRVNAHLSPGRAVCMAPRTGYTYRVSCCKPVLTPTDVHCPQFCARVLLIVFLCWYAPCASPGHVRCLRVMLCGPCLCCLVLLPAHAHSACCGGAASKHRAVNGGRRTTTLLSTERARNAARIDAPLTFADALPRDATATRHLCWHGSCNIIARAHGHRAASVRHGVPRCARAKRCTTTYLYFCVSARWTTAAPHLRRARALSVRAASRLEK